MLHTGEALPGSGGSFQSVKDMKKAWQRPLVHMVARWKPEGLAMFDTEAWGTPEVHSSAAPDVLAGKIASSSLAAVSQALVV